MSKTVTISVDAMGGDFGPCVTVPAAIKTIQSNPLVNIILVGDEQEIQSTLQKQSYDQTRVMVIHASEVIGMEDTIAVSLRVKKDSSMRVAINLVKTGEADACVSAGNTGALMAISRFVLKTHAKIDRPAIITAIPTTIGHCHVLDLGANIDCSSRHLLEFALMGSVLAQAVDGIENPKVALLNIGEEEIKGNEQIKEAAELLAENTSINYIGFIEGDGIFRGEADVVVCDGFIGNVMLKTTEGVAKMISGIIKKQINRNLFTKLAGVVAIPIWNALKIELDPGRYNGASLVGLRSIVIKSHGSADIDSYASALRLACKEVEKEIPQLILDRI